MKNKMDNNTSGLPRGGTLRLNVTRAILALVMTLLLGLAGPQAWANNGVAAGHLKVTAVDGSYVNTNVTVTPTVLINGFLPVQLDTWTITTPGR
jgi:hypothetical protein